jgi:hypothetical protein
MPVPHTNDHCTALLRPERLVNYSSNPGSVLGSAKSAPARDNPEGHEHSSSQALQKLSWQLHWNSRTQRSAFKSAKRADE